ncbi:MAG: hypothetical protein ACAH59_00685 [Pseudobdellovibrionaceae bacterium]
MSLKSHVLIEDQFYRDAKKLRSFFDSQFANPKETSSKRFVWDYWHVPDQYTLHRTPAYHYFPQKLYMDFHKSLLMWGRRTLGCWDISPPWLSYYVDGCKQEFHSDVPHGPWAYVYSLTPWKGRKFSGGETLMLKPEVLSYWRNFGGAQDRELPSFVDRIPALMNRLVVFDPRYPHGVTEVRGTRDPREARLVIHGWFMEPKTYIEGPLPAKTTEKKLNEGFDQLQELLQQSDLVQGTVSLQLKVGTRGRVLAAKFATNTLLNLDGEVPASLNREILKIYQGLEFSKARSSTLMTVPLIFQ